MNKAQLLAELTTKYGKVGMVSYAENEITRAAKAKAGEDVIWYLVGVYDQTGLSIIRKNISFYVVDEGKPTEAAYYHFDSLKVVKPEPVPVPVETFEDKLKTYLKTLGWISFSVTSSDSVQNHAIVQAYVADKLIATKAVAQNYLIKMDESGKFSQYTL